MAKMLAEQGKISIRVSRRVWSYLRKRAKYGESLGDVLERRLGLAPKSKDEHIMGSSEPPIV